MHRIGLTILVLWAGLVFAADVEELLKIGDHFLARGEYEDALKNYRRAEAIAPDNPQVLWRIGAAYNLKGQDFTEKARIDTLKVGNSYLARAIKIDRDIPEAHAELAYNLALMTLGTEDIKSIKDFAILARIKEEIDYALKLDPHNARAHFVLGWWHQQVGQISLLRRKPRGLGDADTTKALEEFKKAAKLDKDRAEYWYWAGKSYLAKADTINALKYLTKATKTTPTPINKKYAEMAQQLITKIKDSEVQTPTNEGE